MKANTQKTTTNLAISEYDTNTHIVMLVVYGVLFGAWVLAQLVAK